MPALCDLRVGDRVTVNPTAKYASEWPGVYVVACVQWLYQGASSLQPPRIDVGIISDADIGAGYGYTDGWSPEDLTVVG